MQITKLAGNHRNTERDSEQKPQNHRITEW